jgi:subtilisin family serine protease
MLVLMRTSSMDTMRPLAVMVLLMILLSSPAAALSIPLAETEEISPFTKIDQSLLDRLDTDEQIDLLVRFDDAAEHKARSAISILDKRAEIVEQFDAMNMLRVKLVGSAIIELARSSFIKNIWSNEPRPIDAPDHQTSAGYLAIDEYASPVDAIGARNLWEQGYNGSGIVIAVLDTGIDFMHPDLDDFDDNSSTADMKVTAFASFTEIDALPFDIMGHGTYAASVAAGTGNSSDGLYAGIAPGATLLSAKVTFGGLLAVPSWIVAGIEWACSHGADIILLPFNTFGAPGDAVAMAVKAAAEKGVFVVAAAGDDGPDYLTIMSPGGSAASFTVGAFDLQKQEVPAFSGRGPSLEMLTKPDIVAPGMGIIGAKHGAGLSGIAGLGSFSLGDMGYLGGLGGLMGGALGEDLDDNYIIADSTAASAAIAAGAAAILMQAFDRATPIALANVLRDTATPVNFGANDAGAGLLNLEAAFSYLSIRQEPIDPHLRTTGLPLIALGILNSAGNNASTSLMMSSYGTTVVAMDQRGTEGMNIHLLMGMFSLRWNNMDPTNLMMFDVKREMHQVVMAEGDEGYNRWIGIMSYDDKVYVTLLVESYNLTTVSSLPLTAYRVTPFILNLGEQPLANVSLFLAYSLDIFLDGSDDHGKFALGNQQIFAYGISEDYRDFYFGINSSRPLDAFEVGNSSDIASHVSDDNLTGSTTFDGSVGLGMKWHFGAIAPNEPANVTIAMGFGENRTVLDASIEEMWIRTPAGQVVSQGDLIVVEADMPRITQVGEYYQSRAVIMNIGVESADMVGALIIGQAQEDEGALFTRFHSFDAVEPFHARVVTAEWSPEEEGINSEAWVVAGGIESAVALLAQPPSQLTLSVGILDDFLIRDVFVISPIASTSVFPKSISYAPFNLIFPADYGLFTISLSTTVGLGNLTVTNHGNASDWGNASLPASENVIGYYNFSLFTLVPPITMDGYHWCDYVIETEHGWTTNVTLDTHLEYPRAMMVLDTSHGGGLSFGGNMGGMGRGLGTDLGGNMSFPLAEDIQARTLQEEPSDDMGIGDLGSIDDLLAEMRMTTLSGLSEMKKRMREVGLDLVEMPGMDLNADLLAQFSAVFVIGPTKEFNSTEIEMLREFTAGGGKLIIFGDYEDRVNLTGLNPLLLEYGYEMAGKHSEENTTEIITGSIIGANLDSIWLGEGTFILNNQSKACATIGGNSVILLDDSLPEIALFGSSRIFMNKNLVKCNNSILLDNLNEYLLRNTLTCVASLAEDTTEYPVGRSVYLNLDVSDYNGEPVDDLFVVIIFELPNGSLAFFIAGSVENGLYSSQFLPSYWRSSGRINGIFMVLDEDYAPTFASVSFYFIEPDIPTTTDEPWQFLTMVQVAFFSSMGIFGAVMIQAYISKRRKKKQMRIIEVDPVLTSQIDNTLNTMLAAFVQIEDLIRREDLDRVQKVEALRVLMEHLERARKMFRDVSDKVGGV